MRTDFLIIGSGIAGLSLAIKLAEYFPNTEVTVLTKSEPTTSNTNYAQGGIAVVTNFDSDSFEKHIADTLICGGGLCDEKVVEMVITQAPERLKEMMTWGAKFDTTSKGQLDLGKEGGHSENRVVHHKDQTGREMVFSMLNYIQKLPNIRLLKHSFALDLLTENGRCKGAKILNEDTNEIFELYAHKIILATGGIGQIYGHTTNAEIATGDGIAMAKRAGVTVQDMEFIQFHPTAMYANNLETTFLISEAVRGFGAILRNQSGERFMEKYDKRLELAPRDIVSQSIHVELKNNQEKCVYLDCSHLDMTAFKQHFPMIYERCLAIGIDLQKDWISVAPSQHYICGGIAVDTNGETNLKNLFVCGESARTGLHGANRLASNSLLEALVYSDRIFQFIRTSDDEKLVVENSNLIQSSKNKHLDLNELETLKTTLQTLMMQNVSIVRHKSELEKTQKILQEMQQKVIDWIETAYPSKSLYELRNMVEVGLMIVDSSLKRNESVGTFVIEN
ncbi:MAG TPA: L-aspartate oxidase [Crocinitomicaceae bacterium]|nr:L-aspartate oxidase [Crocinitomicaceae bacterium]